jgi:hypothetical protein
MSTVLSDFGIQLVLPAGWYGEIYRDSDGIHDSGPVVHFANSPLILGDRNGYAGVARQTMRPGDVIVCVWNMPSLPQLILVSGGEKLSPTQGWSLAGANDTRFEGVGDRQSSLRRAILVGERVFDLVAFFGTDPPPRRLVAEVDAILATVRVDIAQRERGDRLEQYFGAADALRIQREVRREKFAARAPHMTPDELEAHRRAFPDGL